MLGVGYVFGLCYRLGVGYVLGVDYVFGVWCALCKLRARLMSGGGILVFGSQGCVVKVGF